MKLSTKGSIWTLTTVVLVALNSLLTLYVIRELRLTDQLTTEDYELFLVVRQLRGGLNEYYIHGQNVSRKKATSAERQKFIESKRTLETYLSENLPRMKDPDLITGLASTQQEMQSLLKFEPEPTSPEKAISLQNPEFRRQFEYFQSRLDDLSAESGRIVFADRARNETLASQFSYLAIGMFVLTLLVALARLIFLRRLILKPLQALVETLLRVRRGDLTARWRTNRQDEIGLVSQTLNQTVAELEVRRSERIQIIGAIAHDLKNPLSAVGMSCELLLRKGADVSKEDAMKLVRNIHAQANRLRRMTEDLLSAANAVNPELDLKVAPIRLSDLAREMIDLFQGAYPNRRYTLIQHTALPEILADQDRVAQVVTNLISNATKYSTSGTEVELEIGSTSDAVFFEIRDRGIGIPEDKREAIFQPFTRLERGRGMSAGLGLGLATVKSIVQAHSGHLSVHSRPGGGTVFRVELPLARVSLPQHPDQPSRERHE